MTFYIAAFRANTFFSRRAGSRRKKRTLRLEVAWKRCMQRGLRYKIIKWAIASCRYKRMFP